MTSNPSLHCSSASPKVHVLGSHRTENSSTRVDRRPCMIHPGAQRAIMRCMTALSPSAPLPLRSSTLVRVFRVRPAWMIPLRAFPLDGELRAI